MKKIKTNGAEFNAFYHDDALWPDGVWHDDTVIVVDGKVCEDYGDALPPSAEVVIESGYVLGKDGEDLGSFTSYFTKWRKAQTVRRVSVEVAISDFDRFVELVKGIGGKVVA
jgi:hypothetical protein